MRIRPLPLPKDYPLFLQDIKTKTRKSQKRAAQAVNQELIQLYWWIGSEIVKLQKQEGWKPRMIEQFCKDVQSSFPGTIGFSPANLLYMRTFYLSHAEAPPDYCLAIPWGHHLILMKKISNLVEREWYARKILENGWSCGILTARIESDLYHQHT